MGKSLLDTLTRIAIRHGLQLTPQGVGWQLELPLRGNLRGRLTIGPDARDWYLTLSDAFDGREVWSDWMDYLGYDDRSEEQLINDKGQDLAWFVGAWINAPDVRIIDPLPQGGLPRKTAAEWSHAAAWQPIQLHDPAR